MITHLKDESLVVSSEQLVLILIVVSYILRILFYYKEADPATFETGRHYLIVFNNDFNYNLRCGHSNGDRAQNRVHSS